MNESNRVQPEDDDDWEERYADPWNLTQKELRAFTYRVLLPLMLLCFGFYGLIFYNEYVASEKRHDKRQAAQFTWPPPETYDSSSLKR